jgi:hypothetical protein
MRAKFQVQELTKMAWGQERAKLSAVPFNKDKPEGEDSTFAKATPNGSMEIYIDNPGAQGFLKPGSYYYLDFTESPE